MYNKDAAENFMEEMPLSLKLEQFQRRKLLEGLKPVRDAAQKDALKYLQSLKYVQKLTDDADELTEELRGRQYREYCMDPLGKQKKAEIDKAKDQIRADPFYEGLKMI